MASHGTDQTIVQRLLAASSRRQAQLALLASAVIVLFQFALFLVLGVMLYAFNGAPGLAAGQSYDSVFPLFIVTQMPTGLRGIVLAAIFAVAMSNASGSLNSLAASSVIDFKTLRGTAADPDANDPVADIAAFTMDDAGMGRCPAGAGNAALGAAAARRTENRVHNIWKFAGIISAEFLQRARERDGRDHRNGGGNGGHALYRDAHQCRLDMVRFDRHTGDVRGRFAGEFIWPRGAKSFRARFL